MSSIRSNEPQLRLAFVRLDYHASDTFDVFFLGGQDWTLFGSGALENIVETTFNGAFWGNIWERSPQLRGGFIWTLDKEHHVNLEPQFGIMMPSTGQILKLGIAHGLAGQLGQGEREGADSDRPEQEGRVALSYQLDQGQGCRAGANRAGWIPFQAHIDRLQFVRGRFVALVRDSVCDNELLQYLSEWL